MVGRSNLRRNRMRIHRTDSTDPGAVTAGQRQAASPVPKKNWRPVLLAGVVLFIAVFVRVFFAYGVSAGSDFALSGGTAASNNLYALEKLLSEGAVSFVNGSMYYPYGSANVAPMLFTLVMYPFALVANVFLQDTVTASSFALALSGPLFGVLACIPVYFIGKELTGRTAGGMLAMLFMALCPVAVQQTVFSNGSGISFTLLFAAIAVLFMIKALKALGGTDSARDAAQPKAYLVPALVSGIMLAIAGLSWTGYRAVILPLLAVMVAQALLDRFRGRDPMPAARVYSAIALLGSLIPAAYYVAAGQWDLVASGTTIIALFASAMCVAYSALARKPWTIVLPVFVIVAVAFFALLAVFAPGLYSATVGGNSLLNGDYSQILSASKLSLSTLAAYFGWLTFWFLFIVVAYRLYKVRENISSPLYIATIIWPFFMFLCCCHTASEAAVAAVAFSAAFAMLTLWVLDRVDLKAYFGGIRAADGKHRIRKLFKPIPFATVLVAVLLVAAPNMMYAVDAGISTSQAEEINESSGTGLFGGVGYYVHDEDSWKVPAALEDAGLTEGTMGGWFEYSDDIALSGLNSMTDAQGNGALAVSQILLSDGVNGGSTAAMLIAMLMYTGMTDEVKSALLGAGLTQEQLDVVEGVYNSADYQIGGKTVRYIVTTDNKTYGVLSQSVSDINVQYAFLKNYLEENCGGYRISDMYEAVCDASGKSFDYMLLTGDMMPLYYSSVFIQMALMTGHVVNSSTYAVDGYMSVDWTQYYTNGTLAYTYTDAMYDSLLYRAYIGMTPSEAGYSSLSEYIEALRHADASVKMAPCYGLGNYEVVYWQVMYNPDPNASSDSDGWVQMDAREAIVKQAAEGGIIDYLSGLPMIIAYSGNSAGGAVGVSGQVTDGTSGEGVSGIQVSAIGSDGNIRATAFTGEDGRFTIKAHTGDTIVYYAASSGTTGVLLGSMEVEDGESYDLSVASESQVTVELRFLSGGLSQNVTDPESYVITFTGTNTGKVYEGKLSEFQGKSMALDRYEVKVTNGSNTVYSGEFVVADEASYNAVFNLDTSQYTLTIRDVYGTAPSEIAHVRVHNGDVDVVAKVQNGKAVLDLPRGTYSIELLDVDKNQAPYMVTNGSISVSSSSGSRTVYVVPAATVTAPDEAFGSAFTVTNNAYTASFIPTAESPSVQVPVSEVAETGYTAYYIKGSAMYYTHIDAGDAVTVSGMSSGDVTEVTGKMTDASGAAASGTVTFLLGGGAQLTYGVGEDGTYRALIPAPDDNKVTIYATDSTDAFIGEKDVSSGTADIALTAADRVRGNVSWDGGGTDTYYAYTTVDITVKNADGAVVATMELTAVLNSTSTLSSSSNRYTLYLPDGMGADIQSTVTSYTEGSDAWLWYETGDSKDRAGSHTASVAADHSSSQTKDFDLKNSGSLTVTNDLSGEVSLVVGSGDAQTIAVGETKTYTGGVDRRSVPVDLGSRSETAASTEYYFDGTYAYNPMLGTTEISLSKLMGFSSQDEAEKAVHYKTVYIPSKEGDTVAFGNGEDSYYKGYTVSDEASEYNGCTQYMLSRDGDAQTNLLSITRGDQIYYDQIDLSDAAVENIDYERLLSAARTVKGYIGVVADGTITATNASGLAVSASVTDGTYEMKLTDGDWTFEYTASLDNGAEYSGGTSASIAISSDTRVNMTADGTVLTVPYAVTELSTGGVMKKVQLTISADYLRQLPEGLYSITPGSAWMNFSASYGSQSVSNVYIDGSATDLTIIGWYNSTKSVLGGEDLLVTLKNGDITVYSSNGGDYPTFATEGTVYLDRQSDVIGTYEYSYVYRADNRTGQYVVAVLDIPAAPEGWMIQVSQTFAGLKSTVAYDPNGDVDSKEIVLAPGINELTITYIPEHGASAEGIPDLGATLSCSTDSNGVTLSSYTGSVKVEAGVAQLDGVHSDAQVSAGDMTADGRGVFNALGDMPMIVWVLFALIVLLAILTLWMAFKRGVFARRR